MGGILPLTLSSSADGRSSVIFNPEPDYLRRLTTKSSTNNNNNNMTPSSSTTPQPLPMPGRSDLRRVSAFRVSSSRGSSATLPSNTSEWKKAVADVKRKYHSGKYRASSQRCCEILEALEGGETTVSTPEPVFLVYLRFYAASSDEMRALPLASPSAMRTRLLKDARAHYDKAASLIHDAEESIEARRSRSSSTCSSVSSVPPLSPGLTASSVNSTPRTSVCSLDAASIMQSSKPASTTKKPKKKKVSFSGLPDLTIEIPKPASHSQKSSKRHMRKRTNSIPETEEPYIRPDSPTLGWEDDLLMVGGSGRTQYDDEMTYSSPIANMRFPSPPLKSPSHSPSHSPSSSVSSSSPQLPSSNDSSNLTTPEDRSPITPIEDDIYSPFASLASELSSFANSRRERNPQDEENWPFPALTPEQKQEQQQQEKAAAEKEERDSQSSLNRVGAQLSALKAQVTWHRSAVEDLLNTVTTTPASSSGTSSPVESGRNSPASRSATPCSPTGSSFVIPSRFLSSACSTSRASSSLSCSSSGSVSDIADRKERIERLRSQGWQRKRFDASRYEALREAALGDLARPGTACA